MDKIAMEQKFHAVAKNGARKAIWPRLAAHRSAATQKPGLARCVFAMAQNPDPLIGGLIASQTGQ
jgi:hypothetical protein